MSVVEDLAVGGLTLLTGVLALVAWRAFTYRQSMRLLFVAAGFTILFLKAVVLTLAVLLRPPWSEDIVLTMVLFDLALVLAIYLGLSRPARA